tara:strand:+ start:142 stop:486 length:345 start_codon:yes stop_codon:yes gene_type:complete
MTDYNSTRSELQRDYYRSVNSIVDDIEEDMQEGQSDPDDYTDRVSEHVDSSEWVIYTWRAMEVLRISDHGEAYMDYGTVDLEGGIPWSLLAYAAMEQDVHEAYSRRQNERQATA